MQIYASHIALAYDLMSEFVPWLQKKIIRRVLLPWFEILCAPLIIAVAKKELKQHNPILVLYFVK